jgi:hypothetical protein
MKFFNILELHNPLQIIWKQKKYICIRQQLGKKQRQKKSSDSKIQYDKLSVNTE